MIGTTWVDEWNSIEMLPPVRFGNHCPLHVILVTMNGMEEDENRKYTRFSLKSSHTMLTKKKAKNIIHSSLSSDIAAEEKDSDSC